MMHIAALTTRTWAVAELAATGCHVTQHVRHSDIPWDAIDAAWLPATPAATRAAGLALPGLDALHVVHDKAACVAPIIHAASHLPHNPPARAHWKILDYKDDRYPGGLHYQTPLWAQQAIDNGHTIVITEPAKLTGREYRATCIDGEPIAIAPYLANGKNYSWGVDNRDTWHHMSTPTHTEAKFMRDTAQKAATALKEHLGTPAIIIDLDPKLGIIEINHPCTSAWYDTPPRVVVEALHAAWNHSR